MNLYCHRLGADRDFLTARESILANIMLSPSRPVPAAITLSVLSGASAPVECNLDIKSLPVMEWNSNVHKKYPFEVEQARLFSFR